QVAAATPDHVATVRVVGVDAVLAADDDLLLVADADRHRRAPADLFLARRLPQLRARPFVEGDDERAGAAAVVLVDDHLILVQERRAGHAVVGVHLAKALVPDLLTRGVHAQEAVVAEVSVDALAVGRWRRGGPAVLGLNTLR